MQSKVLLLDVKMTDYIESTLSSHAYSGFAVVAVVPAPDGKILVFLNKP